MVLVTGWFGALFTGRPPDYAAEFLARFQRWEVRTSAYLLLLTDRYPTAGYQDDDYPVVVTIRPGRLNRAAVFFRLVLVIPAWWVTTLLGYGLGPILMVPTWLIVLIRGRMPRPLYEAIAASVRYWARVKAYWYLLTDAYPTGLLGDEPAPALSAAWPAFGAAAPAPGWHEPLQPGLAVGQPVPMPADFLTPSVAPTAPAAPGRLVLSRQGKWLVGLILAVGVATPIALFAMFFVQIAQAPPAGSAPGSAAAGPSASTAATPTASPAPAPSNAPSARPGSTARWLKGLSSLSTGMNAAMGANNQIVTSVSLLSTARRLGHCPAELTALGPPTAQLHQVDRLAVRACQSFARGARYFAAAARFLGPDGSATDQHKVNKLLDRGDANANRGSDLISTAVADGSFTGPRG